MISFSRRDRTRREAPDAWPGADHTQGGVVQLSASERVRIGVVGLGLIGQVAHLPNLVRLHRSFAITHVSDLSPVVLDSVALGLPGTPRRSLGAGALIDDPEVDAVMLLTPGAHAPLAEAALRAGKHVLSEKPLCVSQAEARRLGALAAERGLVLQVAYMKAYDPSMPAAREAIAGIGDIVLIDVEVRHPSDERQISPLDYVRPSGADPDVIAAAEAGERAESAVAIGHAPAGLDRLYRGVLLGSVVHELAALRALGFALPSRWQQVTAVPFDPAAGDADPPSIAATAVLGGRTMLRLQWLWVPDYPRYDETISVVGTEGAVHLSMPQPYGPNVPAGLRVETAAGPTTTLDDGRHRRDSGFLEELRVFHAAITNGATVPTGAAAAQADTASLQHLLALIAEAHGLVLGGEAAIGPAPEPHEHRAGPHA